MNKKARFVCLVTTLIIIILSCVVMLNRAKERRAIFNDLALVLTCDPLFPAPSRVPLSETNYYNMLLSLDDYENTNATASLITNIVTAITPEIMNAYVSPVLQNGRVEMYYKLHQCGQILASYILSHAESDSLELLSPEIERYKWLITGLRSENRSNIRWYSIDLEALFIKQFKDNIITNDVVYAMASFNRTDYLNETCELLEAEIQQSLDLSCKRSDENMSTKRSLSLVTNFLHRVSSTTKPREYRQLILEAYKVKDIINKSTLPFWVKRMIENDFESVLIPDLKLHELKESTIDGRTATTIK